VIRRSSATSGRPVPTCTRPDPWFGFSTHRSGRSAAAKDATSVPDHSTAGTRTAGQVAAAYAFMASLSPS
jgi:hypothetical protein